MVKVGQNDPCPCGSSKKYKKCCQSIIERVQRKNLSLKERLLERAQKYFANAENEAAEAKC